MAEIEPKTREEKLWNGEDIEPVTREEMYIKHIFDKTQTIPDHPITRKEMLMEKAGEGGDITIKQLTATENRTYSEEGTAYSPVIVNVPEPVLDELTVTENGTYTPPSGTDGYNEVTVSVPLPSNAYLLKEIEDVAIASFDDGADLPMPKLKVAIEPVQEGSGDPSPTNIRPISGWDVANVNVDGFNQFDDDLLLEASGWSKNNDYYTGTIAALLSKYANGIWVNKGRYTGQFCLSFIGYMSGGSGGRFEFKYTDGTTSSVIFGSTEEQRVVVSTEGKVVEKITINYGSSGVLYLKNLCINISEPSKDGQYIPYNGHTYTIDLDGTRYGGTLDVVSGVLTVTHGYIASYNGETLPSTWISDRDVYAEGTTPTIGAEVCYELATPTTIQLTPTMVKSLLGQNNIFADCGNINELSYFGK